MESYKGIALSKEYFSIYIKEALYVMSICPHHQVYMTRSAAKKLFPFVKSSLQGQSMYNMLQYIHLRAQQSSSNPHPLIITQ